LATSPSAISASELTYRKLRIDDNFSSLNFRQRNGQDKGGLQEFITKEAIDYQNENLGVTYVFFYAGEPVAFITLSMGQIEVRAMLKTEKVQKARITEYPCLFIGRLAVHEPFRERGVGSHMCFWALSKARRLSEEVGCRYVALQAVRESIGFYSKCRFQCIDEGLKKDKTWMYRKIIF